MKLAVFASGSGSNFGAIMEAIRDQRIQGAEIVLLVCDKPGAYVLERAASYEVPTFVFSAKDYPNKVAFETEILRQLDEAGVELIVLAGYMRLIGDTLLKAFGGRMINLHPSILPSFTGKDAIGQAFNYGVKMTGVTVHFVDEGMDTGPIIAQRMVPVEEGDTIESLAARIHKVEHEILPKVVQLLANNHVKLENRKVKISKGVE